MAARSSLLARRIPWTEEPGGLIHGVTESGASERLSVHTLTAGSLPLHQAVPLGLVPRLLVQGGGGAPPGSSPPGAIFAALDSAFLFICLAL